MNAKQEVALMVAEDRRFGEKQKQPKMKSKVGNNKQKNGNSFRNMDIQDLLEMEDDEYFD